ncbi:MAG: sodium/proton-translocating pyrophosphatase [Planctomycetes bacterium]|nr:sodium/proton-translocating pyrophosphatase [Planctomycetota bacterium]
MNRLEKNAWVELISVAVSTVLLGMMFAYLVKVNASGMIFVMIIIVAGIVLAAIFAVIGYKMESKYDEREKKIRHKAFYISAMAMTGCMTLMCLIPFFLIGGKGGIAVYYLPMIFCGCLLVAQAVMSSVILFECAKEQADE